jgi:hypothetical protein
MKDTLNFSFEKLQPKRNPSRRDREGQQVKLQIMLSKKRICDAVLLLHEIP